jgi:predicted RNase H-like HicB family nuclease
MVPGTFTAVVHKEDDLYVADCPEFGTVSQGYSVEEAFVNLQEATELYLEGLLPDVEALFVKPAWICTIPDTLTR